MGVACRCLATRCFAIRWIATGRLATGHLATRCLAIRWIVDNSRKKKGKPMAERLAEEMLDAYNGTGASVQWKETVHKMAEANKAYSHYAR